MITELKKPSVSELNLSIKGLELLEEWSNTEIYKAVNTTIKCESTGLEVELSYDIVKTLEKASATRLQPSAEHTTDIQVFLGDIILLEDNEEIPLTDSEYSELENKIEKTIKAYS